MLDLTFEMIRDDDGIHRLVLGEKREDWREFGLDYNLGLFIGDVVDQAAGRKVLCLARAVEFVLEERVAAPSAETEKQAMLFWEAASGVIAAYAAFDVERKAKLERPQHG